MSTSIIEVAGDSAVARTIEHVCRSIDTAAEDREPFGHLRLANVFPEDVYAAMLETMPAREDYRSMSGRAKSTEGSNRTKLDLVPEWIAKLPPRKRPVWEVVGKALRSPEVREAFRRRLAAGLERRFGADYVTAGMYPIPILTRDVPGYRIGIHPDTKWKGMTIQLYLPRDKSIEHVGTIFHKRDSDGKYQVTTRMPFVPNTGYAFAVGPDTYHSADKLGPEVTTRDSILLTYFVDRTFFNKVHNRGKRFGNYLLAKTR